MSRYEERNGLLVPSRRIVDPRAIGFGMPPASAGQVAPPAAGIEVIGVSLSDADTSSVDAPGDHQSGDLVVVCSLIAGLSSLPNLGTSCTNIITMGPVSGSGIPVSARAMYRYANSSSFSISGLTEPVGGGGPYMRHAVITLRGTRTSSPIGDTDISSSSSGSTANFPGLTLDAGGDSVVLAFLVFTRNASPGTPSDMEVIGVQNGSSPNTHGRGAWYLAPAAAFTGKTSSLGGSTRWGTIAVEILAL